MTDPTPSSIVAALRKEADALSKKATQVDNAPARISDVYRIAAANTEYLADRIERAAQGEGAKLIWHYTCGCPVVDALSQKYCGTHNSPIDGMRGLEPAPPAAEKPEPPNLLAINRRLRGLDPTPTSPDITARAKAAYEVMARSYGWTNTSWEVTNKSAWIAAIRAADAVGESLTASEIRDRLALLKRLEGTPGPRIEDLKPGLYGVIVHVDGEGAIWETGGFSQMGNRVQSWPAPKEPKA